jgi:outer membrane protein assembly factor BamB
VRNLARVLPLLFLLLLAAGCARFAKPDGWAPAQVSGDTLFVSTQNGKLSAVDPETYTELWRFPAADEQACGAEQQQLRELKAIYAAPVVTDDAVYFGAWDGNVYALDRATGDCTWDFETDDPIIGGLTLDEDRLFAASTDGNLYVLDAATGEELGRAHAGDVWSRPALAEGVLYVANVTGDLMAFDPDTLEQTWEAPFGVSAGLLTDPTPFDGRVIVGGITEKLYAVDMASGQEQWAFAGAGNWFWGRPLVDGDVVYATNLDAHAYAIDLATGRALWSFKADWPIRPGPVVAEGVVVVVDDKGNVYGLDPATGDLLWNGPTEIKKEVLADPYVLPDGDVMIVSKGGDLFTISPEDGRLTTVGIER